MKEKKKKLWLVLNPMTISTAFGNVPLPKHMVSIHGVFDTKKEALKYGENFLEVTLEDVTKKSVRKS